MTGPELEAVLADVKAGKVVPLYLLWGEEFLVRQGADALVKALVPDASPGLNFSVMDGASPREVMEVVLQTCANFGMPPMLHALEIFVQVMAEDGRLAEIGNPPPRVESYAR